MYFYTILLLSISTSYSCRSCFQETYELNTLVQEWMSSEHPLPSNDSSSREVITKMATAAIAVRRGATNILVTSDITSLNKTMSRLLLDNQPDGVRGIEYYGARLTQASFHYLHRNKIVPDNPCKYRIRRHMNPLLTIAVQCQTTAREGTDKQGAYMLIDERSPPVFVTSPKLSIIDFSNTFFDYEGLWAAFPSFLSGELSQSIWGLWVQRLVQELGQEVAITSLSCRPGSKVKVGGADPYRKAERAFEFIKTWQCSPDKSFFQCALHLGESMKRADLVTEEELMHLGLWVNELKKSRYEQPRRQSNKIRAQVKDHLLGCIIHSPARVTSHKNEIIIGNHFPNIFPFCKNLPRRPDVIDPFRHHGFSRSRKVEDIALVIIFYDASIYSNIQFLQDIYSKYFQNLIYCGPDFHKFQVVYKNLGIPLSFIEVPDTKGFVAYECVSRAIMMNYDVNGYLEMADDVILNTWTLGNIPRDRFWFQKDLRTASRHQQIMNDFALSYPFPWWPWTVHGQMWGAKAMAKVWKTFESIQTFNNTKSKQIVSAFLSTLQHNSGSYDKFFYCSSDIFYVPSKFRQSWAMLSDIFFSNNVFLDIAVPTLMNGMDSLANIIRMEGIYLWYNERGNYPAYYRSYHQFFHPWKMGWIHRSDHANFLCFHLLPNIVKDLKVSSPRHANETSG